MSELKSLMDKGTEKLSGKASEIAANGLQKALDKLTSKTNKEDESTQTTTTTTEKQETATSTTAAVEEAAAKVVTEQAIVIQKQAEQLVEANIKSVIAQAADKVAADCVGKSSEEKKATIEATIRAYSNSFFNNPELVEELTGDVKRQLNILIDEQIEEKLGMDSQFTEFFKPLDVLVNKTDKTINPILLQATRLDVTKELDDLIGDYISDPLKKVNQTLNKYHLTGLQKALNNQVESIQSNIASKITANIKDDITKEQKKILDLKTVIANEQNKIKQYEQQARDFVKDIQDKVNAELKKIETQMIDEISKSIKLKF